MSPERPLSIVLAIKASQKYFFELTCQMMVNLLSCIHTIEYADLTRYICIGMVDNRNEHREPVIRAFVALPVETLVEVIARCLPGSGLCVSAALINRNEQYICNIKKSGTRSSTLTKLLNTSSQLDLSIENYV